MPANKGERYEDSTFSAALVLMSLLGAEVRVQQGPVTWSQSQCGFSWCSYRRRRLWAASWKRGPQVGHVVEGDDIVAAKEWAMVNQRSGDKHSVIHWANAKHRNVVRNTPVQCASKWEKKKK